MDKSYLIKRKSLLLAGIKDADNTASIIGFDNMSLRTDPLDTDPSNFVIPTEGKVNQMVIDAERNSHKQIKGEISVDTEVDVATSMAAFAAGTDLTLDDGSTYNNKPYDATTAPNGATAGDVVFYVASPTATNFKTEEALVKSDYTMVLLSSTNSDDKRLDTVEGELDGISDDLEAISNEDVNNLKVSNDKDITGHGALVTDGTVIEGGKIARRDEITSALASLKQEADANKHEADATKTESASTTAQVALNTPAIATNKTLSESNASRLTTIEPTVLANANQIGVNQSKSEDNSKAINTLQSDVSSNTVAATDYANSKSDFVKVEDIQGGIDVHFDVPFTQSGKQTIADISSVDMSKFVKGSIIVGVATPITAGSLPNEYGRDSYDDGASTDNVLVGQDVQVTITPTQLINEFVDDATAASFVANYHLTKLSQLTGAAGANIDSTARIAAADARTLAVSAQTTADAADTLSKANKGQVDVNTAELNTRQPIIAANTKGVADNHADIVKHSTAINSHTSQITAINTNITKNVTAIATKQDKTDNSLTTSTKSVVGAINELKTRTDNNEADTVELNKGKFDIKGDGTKVTEIFDTDGELKQSIKDLTHLTTQDEIYNTTAVSKWYIIKVDWFNRLSYCVTKSATTSMFMYFTADETDIINGTFAAAKGGGVLAGGTYANIGIADPISNIHATTKKYVDDAVAGVGGGGTWTEVTDLATRIWTNDDAGKKVRITYNGFVGSGLISTFDAAHPGTGISVDLGPTKWSVVSGVNRFITDHYIYNSDLIDGQGKKTKNSTVLYSLSQSYQTEQEGYAMIDAAINFVPGIPFTKFEIEE